jgi:hypothetical protein
MVAAMSCLRCSRCFRRSLSSLFSVLLVQETHGAASQTQPPNMGIDEFHCLSFCRSRYETSELGPAYLSTTHTVRSWATPAGPSLPAAVGHPASARAAATG